MRLSTASRLALASLSVISVVQAAAIPAVLGPSSEEFSRAEENCFPYGSATLDGLNKPNVSRAEWWCPNDLQYGFLGFSYPLEIPDCSDPSNGYDQINTDFARMKSQFGATLVRIYAPECREESVWINILNAGINNNLGVITQVWWGFDSNQSLWKLTANAIISVLEDETYGPVAPYVFHSVEFGSEPIGDGVDGGSDQFTADLKKYKNRLAPYGIPITISEDWDRPDIMSNDNWSGLGPVGQLIAPVIDQVHIHPMPYYHPDEFPTADNVWSYFQQYIPFINTYVPGKPIIISQTMWSSVLGGSHDRGGDNPGENLGNFTEYWDIIMSNCDYWKQYQVGWLVHTFDDSQEYGLGLIDDNGNLKMPFNPPRC